MIEADVLRVEVASEAEPDIFAARNALGRVDALADRAGYKSRQIQAAVGEGIVLEDHHRIVRLRRPARAQLANRIALVWAIVPRPTTADDDDLNVRLQLVDVVWRIGVRPVGTANDFLVGMRLADFVGHAVDEIPDVIGQFPARPRSGESLPSHSEHWQIEM